MPLPQPYQIFYDTQNAINGLNLASGNNVNHSILKDLLVKLEGGNTGIAFASGIAAMDAILRLLQKGDEIIAMNEIYGGALPAFCQHL